MIRVPLLMPFLLVVGANAQPHVIFDWKGEDFLIQTIDLSRDKAFSLDEIKLVSQRILADNDRRFVLIRYYGLQEFSGSQPTIVDRTFRQWLEDRQTRMRYRHSFAELARVQGRAVLRHVSPVGDVSRLLLAGTEDPLSLNIGNKGNKHFEILMVDPLRVDGEKQMRVFCLAKAGKSIDLAEQVYAVLVDRFPGWKIILHIRDDVWFVSSWFPEHYPFRREFKPPSEADWRRATQITCLRNRGEILCSGLSGN